MKTIIKMVLLGIAPILAYLLLLVILDGNHDYIIPLTLTSIFLIAFLSFKKTPRRLHLSVGLFLLLPLFLLFLITSLFAGFLLSWPYVIFIPICIYLGWRFSFGTRFHIPLFSVLLFAFVGLLVFPNVFMYQTNPNANINQNFQGLSLVNKHGNLVNLDTSKVLVLDFWTTSCGQCFQKFPQFEDSYLKYRDNPNIAFYSINTPVRGDTFTQTVEMVEDLGYSFPTLYAKSKSEVESLGINAFPHLIIAKDGKIRYSGALTADWNIYVHNINVEIKRILYN